ncbi:MAG: metallophosphoesterase [Anaerolineae bacterium]|nr:metallophosphoesterase [Anaerolineae bacterium]
MHRILHFADLHLDTPFISGDRLVALGPSRRIALRATLSRIFTLARESEVDAVTIAGDLYEQLYVLPKTIDFLAYQFAKLSPIRVFIAPGEHDPYTNDSLYAIARWPENVTIFSSGKVSVVELAPGLHLWGGACPPARGGQTLDHIHIDTKGVNLLLLHAMNAEQSGEDEEHLFTLTASAVQNAGFDFALLGHQHRGQIWPEATPCCVYPGSPEPLAPDEGDGAHQVVLLTIENDICTPELIPINQWRYQALNVDLSACDSVEQAAKRVQRAQQTLPGGDDEHLICTITLTGTLDFPLDLSTLAAQVETKSITHFTPHFSMAYNLKHLAQEQTVRGMLVRRFQKRLANAPHDKERKALLTALNLALQALDGKQVQLYEVS